MIDDSITVEELIKRKRRPRIRRIDSKYKEKYRAELINGIRYTKGLNKVELSHRWRVSLTTIDYWISTIPEFAEAYELGKADYATYWHEVNKKVASGEVKGNAACVVFALTNIEQIQWSSRVEVNSKSEKTIGAININILETPKRAIEHNVVDAEVIEEVKLLDNVVCINDK